MTRDSADELDAVDLFWLPLGAGGHFVRANGRIYERIKALLEHRRPLDIYHAALRLTFGGQGWVIEQAPAFGSSGERGVVAEGPVGARWAGRFEIFRYEVRVWREGRIPDADEAVESPRRIGEGRVAERVLSVAPEVPRLVWGRDELGTGEMWNSNAVIARVLERSGLDAGSIAPPSGGRAPGWRAGVAAARR